MTTSINIRTNGGYVGELKDADGNVLGKAGPGTQKESGWIYVPHGKQVVFAERDATDAEKEQAKAEEAQVDGAEDKA